MTNAPWEEVEVPRGAFISWGNQIGQSVTGKVLDYDERGGTDFSGAVCPLLVLELVEPTYAVDKDGNRTDFAAGELLNMNAGQVSLKRAVRAAALSPGDLVKIELSNLVKTTNGTVKEFSIKVARGAGDSLPPTQTPPASAAPAAPAAPVSGSTAPAAAPAVDPAAAAAALAALSPEQRKALGL